MPLRSNEEMKFLKTSRYVRSTGRVAILLIAVLSWQETLRTSRRENSPYDTERLWPPLNGTFGVHVEPEAIVVSRRTPRGGEPSIVPL